MYNRKKYKMLIIFLFSFLISAVQIYLYLSLTSYENFLLGVFFFISLIYYAIMFFVIVHSNRSYMLKTTVYYLNQQKEASQKHAQLIASSQSQMKEQITQISSQMAEIHSLLVNHQIKQAKHHIGTLSSSFQHSQYHHYSINPVIDIILHNKERESRKHNIQVSYSITFPDETSLPDSSLISLLFNLLDNGIESCMVCGQPAPFLKLTIDYKGDFILFHMINSKNPNRIFTHQTTKENPEFHGLGLSIIENFAKSHDGTWEWIDRGEQFESKIMLRYH